MSNKGLERDRPGIHEDNLDVEKDEQHRHKVKLDAEARLGARLRHGAAFISVSLIGVRTPARPRRGWRAGSDGSDQSRQAREAGPERNLEALAETFSSRSRQFANRKSLSTRIGRDRARLVSPHEGGQRWIETRNARNLFEESIVLNHGIEGRAAGRGGPRISKVDVEGFAVAIGLLEVANELFTLEMTMMLGSCDHGTRSGKPS